MKNQRSSNGLVSLVAASLLPLFSFLPGCSSPAIKYADDFKRFDETDYSLGIGLDEEEPDASKNDAWESGKTHGSNQTGEAALGADELSVLSSKELASRVLYSLVSNPAEAGYLPQAAGPVSGLSDAPSENFLRDDGYLEFGFPFLDPEILQESKNSYDILFSEAAYLFPRSKKRSEELFAEYDLALLKYKYFSSMVEKHEHNYMPLSFDRSLGELLYDGFYQALVREYPHYKSLIRYIEGLADDYESVKSFSDRLKIKFEGGLPEFKLKKFEIKQVFDDLESSDYSGSDNYELFPKSPKFRIRFGADFRPDFISGLDAKTYFEIQVKTPIYRNLVLKMEAGIKYDFLAEQKFMNFGSDNVEAEVFLSFNLAF